MSSRSTLPPPPPLCLQRPYPSSQKGGTLISESVADLNTHRRLLSDPDGYRPLHCRRCLHPKLHAHDFRYRQLRADPSWGPEICVRRYCCAAERCGAIWQILPQFVARWLWRSWRVVEPAVGLGSPQSTTAPPVPERTRQRWQQRLRTAARLVVQALATHQIAPPKIALAKLGLQCNRWSLVGAFHHQLAPLAALIHCLQAGLRLM